MPTVPSPWGPDALGELGERIALLAAQISAATYELLVMLREFDEGHGWNGGFRSCAHWLVWRVGMDLGAAREKMRVARALGELPRLAESLRRGEISYSKVRALTRIATPANEQELLEFGRAGTAAHVETLVRGMRRVDRLARGDEAKRHHAARYLHTYTDEDGMVVIKARLAPEAAAAVLRAIDAGVAKLYGPRAGGPAGTGRNGESAPGAVGHGVADPGACPVVPDPPDATPGVSGPPHPVSRVAGPLDLARAAPALHGASIDAVEASAEQRRVDALVLVAESALAGGLDPGTRGDRYQVVVHVDAEALPAGSDSGATCLADGAHVSAETSRRLACDAALVVMRHAADGRPLSVGRRSRAISPGLRRALEHRDRGCRFPGCSARLCDAHHVRHWADGGETDLANTVLLCRFHHRLLHEEGFSMKLAPSGEVRFYWPDGKPLPQAPPAPGFSAPSGKPFAALTSRLLSQGVAVNAKDTLPNWWGERVDYAWEIEWLLHLAAGGAASKTACNESMVSLACSPCRDQRGPDETEN